MIKLVCNNLFGLWCIVNTLCVWYLYFAYSSWSFGVNGPEFLLSQLMTISSP